MILNATLRLQSQIANSQRSVRHPLTKRCAHDASLANTTWQLIVAAIVLCRHQSPHLELRPRKAACGSLNCWAISLQNLNEPQVNPALKALSSFDPVFCDRFSTIVLRSVRLKLLSNIMSIKATCPDCGHNAAFNDASAGKKAKCHQCGALFFLPADGGSPKPRQMTTPTAKSKPKSLPPITNQEMDWESISKLEREGDTVQRPPQASRGEDHESEQSGVTSPKRHKRATVSIEICLPSHKAGRKRATTFSAKFMEPFAARLNFPNALSFKLISVPNNSQKFILEEV